MSTESFFLTDFPSAVGIAADAAAQSLGATRNGGALIVSSEDQAAALVAKARAAGWWTSVDSARALQIHSPTNTQLVV